MSHHFDTPTAREDPRINVCDFYLFAGTPSTTVMAMTVNPDAGLSAPDTFREEGLYAFRFDLDEDAREGLAFKVTFGTVTHADGEHHRHVQTIEVRRSTGDAALTGIEGDPIASGDTGSVIRSAGGVEVFAGLAPDLFAGDGAALGVFRDALFKDNRFEPGAFESQKNFFGKRNVTVIVIEVPNALIGHGQVHAWATASLHGHAPEVQVSRWGLPLVTNIFMPDQDMREAYNAAGPADDLVRFAGPIGAVAEKLSGLAGSAADPSDYGRQVIARLCPTTLAYEIGTPAKFDLAGFNGRALADDVMDVILTIAANRPLSDGVAPDASRIRDQFPYFGQPYTAAEQVDVTPVRRPKRASLAHAGAMASHSLPVP